LIFNWLAEKINNRHPLHSLHAIIVTFLYNLEKLLTKSGPLNSVNNKNLNLIRLSKSAFFLTRVKKHSAPGRWNKSKLPVHNTLQAFYNK